MRMVVVALSIAALLLSGDRMTFAQPASRPPVMRLEEGRLTALQKKTASCRTEGAGKGLNDQDLRDYVTFCAQEARLACLKKAAEQKVRGRERVSFVDKCLRGE